jgi:hypothetical protein
VRRALALAATTIVALGLSATPARAAPPAVTLQTSTTTIVVGHGVTLSGQTDPATGGATVEIRDPAEQVLATATTGAAGAYSIRLSPEETVTLHAVWGSTASDPITVRVRARVEVRLPQVRLFDVVTVHGSVWPTVAGGKAVVELRRGGRVVRRRRARVTRSGAFRQQFRIDQPGTYRVRAWFSDATHLKGSSVDGPRKTRLPSLHKGSHGIYVSLLEHRLVKLDYRLVRIDKRYDFRTADAVLAFRKVQRMRRIFSVNAATWRALADPRRPHPHSHKRGFHIEADQTRQVLYTVQDGAITNILHISSGKPSTPTHDGRFRVYRKIAGYSPHRLYYPSYFDGNRALHGWTDVPTYPASHGCVRIPYWNARFIYRLGRIGTRVIVYH